jgi:CrcB protein
MPLAMGFAVPKRENRLTVFSADNSCERHASSWRGGSFFMMAYLWVALGGALGSVARFWLSLVIAARYGETFPWNTLVINVTGSFVIGILGALTQPEIGGAHRATIVAFLMYGICGGYTTFSSFSLQTFNLLRNGEWLYAAGNILGSVILCMIAVWLGWLLGVWFNSMKGV